MVMSHATIAQFSFSHVCAAVNVYSNWVSYLDLLSLFACSKERKGKVEGMIAKLIILCFTNLLKSFEDCELKKTIILFFAGAKELAT